MSAGPLFTSPPLAGEQLRMQGIAAEVTAGTCSQLDGVWRLQVAAVDLKRREQAEAAHAVAAAKALKP